VEQVEVPLTDTDIVSEIVDALVVDLTAACITNLDEDDPTRAGLVRAGRLQANPQTNVTSILVHPNYPGDPEDWIHEEVREINRTHSVYYEEYGSPIIGGAREVGGGRFWLRRGTVELEIFFTQKNYDRATAKDYANIVRRRVEYTLNTATTPLGAYDTFGEHCQQVSAKKSWLLEGGGSGKFLWRGWVFWEALTHADQG
jgi:hypothetical protein